MKKLVIYTLLTVLVLSCNEHKNQSHEKETVIDHDANKKTMITVMETHLNAVTNRDLKTLESTLSPNGDMQLILPSQDIIYTTDKFIEFHREWFKDTTWTFETKILNTDLGDRFGMAITELTYREPERDGKPYFNRQIVSYNLKKIDDNWYVIKDHCTSAEKSTDKN